MEIKKIKKETLAKPAQSIAFQLRITYRAMSRAMEAETMAHGVDTGTFLFLRSLVIEDGLTQKDLISRSGLLQSGTSAALKQMVERGLITRQTDPIDRRKTRMYLTPAAKKLWNKVMPLSKLTANKALAGFNEKEINRLFENLSRIRQNLEP